MLVVYSVVCLSVAALKFLHASHVINVVLKPVVGADRPGEPNSLPRDPKTEEPSAAVLE